MALESEMCRWHRNARRETVRGGRGAGAIHAAIYTAPVNKERTPSFLPPQTGCVCTSFHGELFFLFPKEPFKVLFSLQNVGPALFVNFFPELNLE